MAFLDITCFKFEHSTFEILLKLDITILEKLFKDIEFDYIFTKKLTFDKLLNSIIMQSIKICVVGLGYVGLPLARLFSTKYPTVGFDMNQKRVDTLMAGHDTTLEVPDDQLQNAIKNYGFKCTTNLDDLCDCNFIS